MSQVVENCLKNYKKPSIQNINLFGKNRYRLYKNCVLPILKYLIREFILFLKKFIVLSLKKWLNAGLNFQFVQISIIQFI